MTTRLRVPALVFWSLSLVACSRGSGTPAQQERELEGFTRVDVGGAFEVDLDVGPAHHVVISGDDNLLGKVVTEVKGDTLFIHVDGAVVTKTPLRAEISLPALEAADFSGATKADIDAVAGEAFELDASGASHVVLRGEVTRFGLDASGATEVEARELRAQEVRINVSGATRADVTATASLDADASGSSKIRYWGDPPRKNTDTSGAASIAPG